MSDLAISIQGLGKQYALGQPLQGGDSFREAVYSGIASVWRRSPWGTSAQPRAGGAGPDKIWALKDVSFDVRRGEVVGLIGGNGAGKSTLLKIISRITEPTTGRISLAGRTASLLEVGTGFHPELTGRENIYLNGAILGMSRREVARTFEQIVDFAEVERFLDTPVKRYSSGMYTRLAFAVAAHLLTDILIVDEVLAVGDMAFQAKCLGAMENLAGGGRTVLFVSHNMGAVERLCSRVVMLDQGQVFFAGETSAGITKFLGSVSSVTQAVPIKGPLRDHVQVLSLCINGSPAHLSLDIDPQDQVSIELVLEAGKMVPAAKVVVSVFRGEQKIVELHDVTVAQDLAKGRARVKVVMPSYFLSPGSYSIGAMCFSQQTAEYAVMRGIGRFSIKAASSDVYDIANMGLVNLPSCGERTVEP